MNPQYVDFVHRAREVGTRQAYQEAYGTIDDPREFVRFLSGLGLNNSEVSALCQARHCTGSRTTVQRWLNPEKWRANAAAYMREWRKRTGHKRKSNPAQRRRYYLRAKLKERLAKLSDSEREQIKRGFVIEPSDTAKKVVKMLRENPWLRELL